MSRFLSLIALLVRDYGEATVWFTQPPTASRPASTLISPSSSPSQ